MGGTALKAFEAVVSGASSNTSFRFFTRRKTHC
jgi:hypothetical protein